MSTDDLAYGLGTLRLRSIQVKIRTFDADSRQVREVTIVHDFMPQ